MDFNKNKIPVGIEILNASKLFKTKRYLLKSLNEGHLNIAISEKKIKILIMLFIKVHNKHTLIHPINVNSDNNLGIPNIKTEIAVATA